MSPSPKPVYQVAAAPEPTPESVAPPSDPERDRLKLARNGFRNKRTDVLGVPTAVASTGTSGQGLNVPV